MDFISIRKYKFYTKEILKIFNIALLGTGFIIAIILMKYKPMYEVKISGEEVGYIQNKKALDEAIDIYVKGYTGKNIKEVNLTEEPEFELKLVEKSKEKNESEIVIALQKQLDITYEYYEIAVDENVIENVDTIEVAEEIAKEVEEATEGEIKITINEKTTTEIEELNTDTIEIAKENVYDKLRLNIPVISKVNGIKISNLPVSGIITSRYGVSSNIRSSKHTGLDIAAPKGTEINVVADGKVTFAKYSGSYGNLIKVDHGNGVETWYAHTSKMYVKAGDEVMAGDVIGTVGNTGNSTGSHLHLELRINGVHVNPQKYLYN